MRMPGPNWVGTSPTVDEADLLVEPERPRVRRHLEPDHSLVAGDRHRVFDEQPTDPAAHELRLHEQAVELPHRGRAPAGPWRTRRAHRHAPRPAPDPRPARRPAPRSPRGEPATSPGTPPTPTTSAAAAPPAHPSPTAPPPVRRSRPRSARADAPGLAAQLLEATRGPDRAVRRDDGRELVRCRAVQDDAVGPGVELVEHPRRALPRRVPVADAASHSSGSSVATWRSCSGVAVASSAPPNAGDELVGPERRQHRRVPAVHADQQVAIALQVRAEPADELLEPELLVDVVADGRQHRPHPDPRGIAPGLAPRRAGPRRRSGPASRR